MMSSETGYNRSERIGQEARGDIIMKRCFVLAWPKATIFTKNLETETSSQ
jgi:hypothetical protein